MEFCIIGTIILVIALVIIKRIMMNKILEAIGSQDWQKALKYLSSGFARMSMQGVMRDNMELSIRMAQNDKKEIRAVLLRMEQTKMKPQYRIAYLQRAFAWYLSEKDGAGCRRCIHEMIDERIAHSMQIEYDVLIKKNPAHIEEIEQKILTITEGVEDLEPQQAAALGSLEYLLGVQYELKQDVKTSEKYYQAAKDHGFLNEAMEPATL